MRYSRPVSWKSQFRVLIQYDTPISGDYGIEEFTLQMVLRYLYEVTNRIDFTASNTTTVSRSVPDESVSVIEELEAGFDFYVENLVFVEFGGFLRKERGLENTRGVSGRIGYRFR